MVYPLAPAPTAFAKTTTLNGSVIVPDFITDSKTLDAFMLNIHETVLNAENDPQRIELIADQLNLFAIGYSVDEPDGPLTELAIRNLKLWKSKLEKTL